MSADPDKPEAARETVEHAAREGRSLAVDVLEEYMRVFRGMSAFYQPSSKAKGARPDPVQFEKWARLALRCAESLAEFQTAKLKAIAVAAPPPEQRTVKFRLNIFDRELPRLELRREPEDPNSFVVDGPGGEQ